MCGFGLEPKLLLDRFVIIPRLSEISRSFKRELLVSDFRKSWDFGSVGQTPRGIGTTSSIKRINVYFAFWANSKSKFSRNVGYGVI